MTGGKIYQAHRFVAETRFGSITRPAHQCSIQPFGVIAQRDDRWEATGTLTVDTRANPHALTELRRHWTQVALGRMTRPADTDWFAYNLASLSQHDLERVRSRLREAFREIRAIVAASEPCEVAALVNLHLVSWV